MQIQNARRWLTQELSTRYTTDEAAQYAVHLLCWALNESSTQLITHPSRVLTPVEHSKLSKALHEHLTQDKPLQYIIGSVPFLTATITIRPPILIPRPETEQWSAFIIKQLTSLEGRLILLDLCTGSGCVAIALAQAFTDAIVYAVDISDEALLLTEENAQSNSCDNIITVNSDLFTDLPQIRFDCIVSNPPYVSQKEWNKLDPTITRWEDHRALVADEEGLSIIERIITEAPQWLIYEKKRQVPQLLIECGEDQADAVKSLMKRNRFEAQIHKDMAGKDRFVTGILVR